ncbi:uncharacterized protein LOC101739093 [Bombyx mori]|uniref:Uncharacterized protein n=1 Tax=Bombyx mori TaxID=7091 RepID=A0A8R2AQ29_BOMMO|nr:uncharacterized protein LOC101739093 [Bombyx mori]
MCNIFSECGYTISNVTYILERLASCCALTAVVSCIVATLTIMLGVGVGLGYNYCFVDMKLNEVKPTTSTSTLAPRRRVFSENAHYNSEFVEVKRTQKPERPTRSIKIQSTIVLSRRHWDSLPSLISKLKNRRKNFTLELLT